MPVKKVQRWLDLKIQFLHCILKEKQYNVFNVTVYIVEYSHRWKNICCIRYCLDGFQNCAYREHYVAWCMQVIQIWVNLNAQLAWTLEYRVASLLASVIYSAVFISTTTCVSMTVRSIFHTHKEINTCCHSVITEGWLYCVDRTSWKIMTN